MSGQFTKLIGNNEQNSFSQEFDNYCSLTKKQRLYGFLATFAIGWILTFASLFTLVGIASNPAPFALLYTLGNLTALASTMFLWGPWRQLKDMFKPIRVGATIIYLVAMGLTLYFAFGLKSVPLVFVGLIFQFCAMVWYSASYIPYGRAMIKKLLGNCCRKVTEGI